MTNALVELPSRSGPGGYHDRRTVRLREAQAVELAVAGHDYQSIADKLGYSSRASAWKAVQRALDRRAAEGVDTLRQIESDRLDAMLSSLWPKVRQGNLRAINAAHRIVETRLRLHGLPSTESGKRKTPKLGCSVVLPPDQIVSSS